MKNQCLENICLSIHKFSNPLQIVHAYKVGVKIVKL